MDFLKTLLAYMALLTTLGVQEGPVPGTVPTPTPLPAYMTATPEPHQTPAPTATAAPTAAPTPAMTPNKRYTQLQYGDSGTNVKKLQNALIELGYMEKGSADGKYGYNTVNAVKAFQKANKLSADGVAGPKTLTILYEDPNVVGIVAPTEVPTATPTPSLPPMPTPVGGVPAADHAATQPAVQAIELTRLDGAYIISGTDGKTLYRETLLDGLPALVRPDMWLTEDGTPVMSLAQLVDCLEGWTLMGSSADGLYALSACGYTVSIHFKANETVILVDGEPVTVPENAVFLQDNILFVTDRFLSTVIHADTVFDADEKSLVVFLLDKSVAQAQD